ncbi:unnamed protein product, partial [Closterium sp. NIES-65]
EFQRRGANVFATSRRVDTMKGLKEKGVNTLALDVTSEPSIQAAVKQITSQTGRVDVLVNNAGCGLPGPLAELPMARIKEVYDTNLFGALALSQAVFPYMHKQRSGRIINVSSVAGYTYRPFVGTYGSSKAAFNAVTNCMRVEMKPLGIGVVLVTPGYIRTNIFSPSTTLKRSRVDITIGNALFQLEGASHVDSDPNHHENGYESSDLPSKTSPKPAEEPQIGGRFFEAGGFGSCGVPDVPDDAECVADLAAFPELATRSGTRTVRRLACLAHRCSPSSHPTLTLLSPYSHPPLTLLSPSSHPPLTLLSPSSHPPLTLLSPSSHPPLTLLSPSSHPPLTLLSPSSHPVLSCCGHVRIVKGRIYFRFGGFEFDWFKMRRFLFSILMIKEAIARYSLHSLTAEFFINTCDAHISKASSVANRRAGLPIFSTHGSIGSIDILYPDPVDLSETYFRRSEADQVPWEQKQSRAVFRGTMTNFHLFYDRQWRPSPRMRLHRMSDVRPDLIDARLVKGVDPVFLDELREDGIKMGGRLGPAELQAFKYEIEVDGGTGTCRTCGILASNQMIIKHASEYFEYFYPLLCPYQHFVPTHRYFDDLFERIEWARDHDLKAQQIVKQANRLARDVCTWEGRRLYWAILLAKYSASALEDPANVTRPAVFKCTVPPIQGDVVMHGIRSKEKPEKWYPRCGSPEEDEGQSLCTHWCSGRLEESKWKWLSADILSGIQGFKPQIPGNKFRDV